MNLPELLTELEKVYVEITQQNRGMTSNQESLAELQQQLLSQPLTAHDYSQSMVKMMMTGTEAQKRRFTLEQLMKKRQELQQKISWVQMHPEA